MNRTRMSYCDRTGTVSRQERVRICSALAALPLLAGSVFGQDAQDPTEPEKTPDVQVQAEPETQEAGNDPLRLKPVMVTARKWEEDVQTIPQSVSVFDAETILNSGISSVSEAAQLVPNMHVTEFSSRRLSFPSFRGISATVGDPAVTTYIDGVPQLDVSSTNVAMLDVERIEFLRGSQGTLFGRNSLGGVIKIETRRPSDTPTFFLSSNIGNFNKKEFAASYSGPIVDDKAYVSISGMFSERDGYTENDITGNDVDSRESGFGRGKFLYTPTDRDEFEFTIYGEKSEDGGFVLGFLDSLRDRSHHIAVDFEGDVDRDILSNSFVWRHFGDSFDITSISSYVSWEIDETADFDFSPIDGVRRFTEESQDYFYQEIRIGSSADQPAFANSKYPVSWLLGGTLFVSEGDESASNEFRPGGAGILFAPTSVGTSTESGDFEDFGLAVFGQAKIDLSEKWDVTAGLRYDYEKKEAEITNSFSSGGFPLFSSSASRDRSFDEFAPSLSSTYDITDNAMVYARVARGFKAGGFNLSAPAGDETFGTETSWSYEGGLKTTLLDGKLIANASAFYIDWKDMQLSQFDSLSGGYITNGGDSTSKGFELDLTARVMKGVDVFGGFGYTEAEFDNFVDSFGVDDDGNNLPFVPETTFHAGIQLNGEINESIEWFTRAEYVNVGKYYFDAGNRESERYSLLNLQAGLEWRNARLAGWMRNAYDEDYVQVAFQPSPVDPTVFVGENGSPQTFGFTLSVEF